MKRHPVTIDVTPHKVVITDKHKPQGRSVAEIIIDYLEWCAFWLCVSSLVVIVVKEVAA